MDRRAVVLAWVLVQPAAWVLAQPAAWAKPPARPKMLKVRGIDLVRRLVLIEVGGVKRAPSGNLFTFTDERGRRYVAENARCDPPFASGARVCELEIPAGYERHRLTSLCLHLGTLKGRLLRAAEAEIAAAWDAALEVISQPEAPGA